jgi:diguanylate cyclase (GGDEF)-like protein
LLAAALTAVVAGLFVATAPSWWQLALAIAAVTLALQLRLLARVGSGVVSVAWGEAALIVGLCLVPAGWLPLVFALGVMLSPLAGRLLGRRRTWANMPAVAILTIAAATAAAISTAVASPYGRALGLAVVAGLLLASIGYLVVSIFLTTAVLALRERVSFIPQLRRAFQRKLLMFVGNVTVGLGVVALARFDWRLLLALPLLLVLLHATYARRLRISENRRMWRAFERSTRALNQADKDAVAVAGVRGALDMFAVGRADLEVGQDGQVRRWAGDETGVVPVTDPLPAAGEGTIALALAARGQEIGTLRLHFPRLAGPAKGDDSVMQAYSGVLAATLHDTETHAELHELLARSAHDAQHDPLTGLLNRVALLTHGETAVQLVPHARPVALLLVDVDHFREINDTLGHAAGDEVLEVTAARLKEAARPGELLARLGGDEFALLVTEPSPGAGGALRRAVRRAGDLVETLAEQANIRGVSVSIEASVGVAVAPAGTAEVSELLRRADAALFEAKHGTGAVGWYDSDHDPGSADRPALLADLRDALARDNELVLLLQPVVDLRNGAPIGAEALVRWRHPQRGVLAPADFIRVVENSDLLATFTEYVLDKALAVAAQLAVHGPQVPVAVNLSARSLLDRRLPGALSTLLRKHQVPGRQLVLEITETVMTRELPGIDEALANLRALGVGLAVDDFGTGFASLTFLTRVPLDEVKVDGALVAQMADSAEAAAIVRTTVELGRDLRLRVVAEGVETAAQEQMLTRLGCVAAQGFHFAEPMPADRIAGTLQAMEAAAPHAEVIPLRPPPPGRARWGDG